MGRPPRLVIVFGTVGTCGVVPTVADVLPDVAAGSSEDPEHEQTSCSPFLMVALGQRDENARGQASYVIPARDLGERLVNSRSEAGDNSVHEHVYLLPSGHREVPILEVWSRLDRWRKLIMPQVIAWR